MRKQAKTVTFCITGALDKMRRVDAIQLIQNETNAKMDIWGIKKY